MTAPTTDTPQVTTPQVEYPWVAICPTCDHYADTIHPVTPDGQPYEDPDDPDNIDRIDRARVAAPRPAPPRWFHVAPCGHVVPDVTAYRWADPTPGLQPAPEPVAAEQTPGQGATESTDAGEQPPAGVSTPIAPSPPVSVAPAGSEAGAA